MQPILLRIRSPTAHLLTNAAPLAALRARAQRGHAVLRRGSIAAPVLNAVSSQRRSFASGAMGFSCTECGQPYAKWQGQCSTCQTWSSIAPAKAAAPLYRQSNAASYNKTKKSGGQGSVAWAGAGGMASGVTPVFRMKDVEMDTFAERIELPDKELNWVLGGGLVAGSLTLVAGNPGVGKSTLALQMANMIATTSSDTTRRRVLYVSGEESVLQIKMRAERLGATGDELFVGSETNIDTIIQMIEAHEGHDHHRLAFDAVVVDSIQTVYAEDIASPAGTVNQVKECTLRMLRLAKQRNIPVLLIGHVTKSGDIAGPKVLEHIVDTVVQLEGDPQSTRRFLRCQKNRFGNTSEVGVFTMTDEGLQPLVNPLMAFVSDTSAHEDHSDSDRTLVDGSSITIAMEGSRPIPLEIQALANRTQFAGEGGKPASGFSRVRGVGVPYDKLQLLFAVLEKRGKVSFYNRNVFVNVAEGYTIHEPAADLAVAVALASAVTNRPVLPRAMFIGEIALSGHLRPVKMLESRLTAAHKIGLDVCVIPKSSCDDTARVRRKFADKLTIVEASTLVHALHVALQVVDVPSEEDAEELAEDDALT